MRILRKKQWEGDLPPLPSRRMRIPHRHRDRTPDRHQSRLLPLRLRLMHPVQHLRPHVLDEPLHLPVHLLHALAHLQHNRNPRDIHAQIARQIQNELQPLDVLIRVQPRVSLERDGRSSPSRSYSLSVCG